MEERADIELVALARRGDKDAFGLLAERYQSAARRFAMRLVTDAYLAQDLAQEAMLQAYLSLEHLRDPARFRTWLLGIVSNVCRSHLRDRRLNFFSLETMAGGLHFDAMPFSSIDPTPQEMVEQRELHQTMLDAIGALPSKDREATLLFYYDQLSLREIAALLGTSLGAVKVRLHRARQRLKGRLLSQHSGVIQGEQRRKNMIKVTIADVVKRERGDEQGVSQAYTIVLQDEAGRRALAMWVGPFEGHSIAINLGGFDVPRPLTYSFFASLLQAIDARVEEVRITKLQGDTFHAVVKIRCGTVVSEVDARPSDSMALATLTDSPIFVAEDVMKRAGMDIPAGAKASVTRDGVRSILGEIRQMMETAPQAYTKERKEEELSWARDELMTHVFSVEE